ncbi:MAG: hypothetical protein MR545_06990 [Veillonellaceae bacterium]|nr:hypothetical protein [Veillonellaceae bacterium]
MSEKLRKIAKLINSGTSSLSIHRKRDYYRHIASINAEARWYELGARLRASADKVVRNYQ